uniref:Uncharacterized protein n=1 Tax=Branchiostoma floridae TaxID=7739 RepID=C3ZIG6_BRAFL|eukprot:XP_002591680.1 hypothetical protein BRAFLDRAFT_80768 [Branchiostoma floridae]
MIDPDRPWNDPLARGTSCTCDISAAGARANPVKYGPVLHGRTPCHSARTLPSGGWCATGPPALSAVCACQMLPLMPRDQRHPRIHLIQRRITHADQLPSFSRDLPVPSHERDPVPGSLPKPPYECDLAFGEGPLPSRRTSAQPSGGVRAAPFPPQHQ